MMKMISIENIGPITKLSIPVPEEGGLVVLGGRNGSGKSTALEAIDTAISGRGRLAVRDGARSGELDGLGVLLKVARSQRRTGELEVQSLEGRLSVAELVDPGLKSDDAADAKRIRALLQLSGAAPSLEAFYPLLGTAEDFAAVVGESVTAGNDLVEMADKVKRAIEKHAQVIEERQRTAHTKGLGMLATIENIDTSEAPIDSLLQAKLETYIRKEAELKADDKRYRDEIASAVTLNNELDALKARNPNVEAYRKHAAMMERNWRHAVSVAEPINQQITETKAKLAELELAAREANSAEQTARERHDIALEKLEDAAAVVSAMNAIQEQLKAIQPKPIALTELEAAASKVASAKAAIEQAAIIRQAITTKAAAEELLTESRKLEVQAARLRSAARNTDDVLTAAVGKLGTSLRVEAGRLVLNTESRGSTYFSELSHGERWKTALDVAIEAVGENGLIVVPQEAWEGLDSTNRKLIAEHVHGKGVVVITAENTDDTHISARVA